jgi:hypothetical protein
MRTTVGLTNDLLTVSVYADIVISPETGPSWIHAESPDFPVLGLPSSPSPPSGLGNQVSIQHLKKAGLSLRVIDVEVQGADCRSRIKRPPEAKDRRVRRLPRAPLSGLVTILAESVYEGA